MGRRSSDQTGPTMNAAPNAAQPQPAAGPKDHSPSEPGPVLGDALLEAGFPAEKLRNVSPGLLRATEQLFATGRLRYLAQILLYALIPLGVILGILLVFFLLR